MSTTGGGQGTVATTGTAGGPGTVATTGTAPGQGTVTTIGGDKKGPGSGSAKAAQATKGAAPTTPPKPPKPAWQEFKLNPKTTIFLDFTESSPDMIISILSRTAGITILKDPSFKSPMTVTSAKAVGLDEAFEIFNTMLGMNGYELRKQGNLMIVSKKQQAPPPMMQAPPPPPPPEEKPVIKVYKLNYASAQQISRVVNEVFSQQQLEQIIQGLQNGGGFNGGPQFGGRQGGPQQPKAVRASSEDYSNSVVVTAMPKFQTDVEALIRELDKPSETPLDSQIFKLKYIDVDEAVDAVNSVLTANKPTGKGAGKSSSNDQSSFYGFYGYNPFGSSRSQGGETAVAVKQTNSIIVSATKANLDIVRKLIADMDKEASFIGTTFVVHLENAKAADVATLLNQAFTKRRDQSQDDNPFFFFYSDSFGGNNKKKDVAKDVDEHGEVVNVRDLTGKVNVIADPNTNSVIVVTMPSNMRIIKHVVEQLDHIAEQVMIETVIVEANLDKTTKLGVEYKFLQNKVLNWNASATGGQNFGGVQGTVAAPAQGFSYTLNGNDYNIFLNALQTDTRFKVLSTPRIFTSNNVKASIDVSQQVPYITSQQAANVGGLITQYDFKSVGVILTVTPRITAAGEVSMEVTQSADDLQGFTTFNAPIINHRQASTTASVKDGETIVLGGIIRATTNLTENKVPILGDIPLLGNLFRSTNRSRGQTELLVLLTPRIVRNPDEARRLREEETKRLSKGSQDAIQKQLNPPPPDKWSP
ncbi:general secretion pathway protein D [Fimbriimonas ginsengisoli Gsoil 348]|uniref:General secretion pathway protein D n=1 Tax=Fimbriimonas ginsengisoli Gsoil 348 TaxID=661478 RepID=A0A068NT96_FIMGI|nr:general secretion pathway protein D [Fimbriimonas ginsengisoli Gsoil 348]